MDSDSEGSSSSDESVDTDVSLSKQISLSRVFLLVILAPPRELRCYSFMILSQRFTVFAKLRSGRTLRMGYTRVQSLGFHWPVCRDCFNKCSL